MKLFRNFLKGASLTTALFIFQACYGPPPSALRMDSWAAFKVVSAEDGAPLPDIAVRMRKPEDASGQWTFVSYTRSDGVAYCYSPEEYCLNSTFRFESEEGEYIVKDTVINDFSNIIDIKLEKAK